VKLSPKRPRRRTWRGDSFTGDFETKIKVGFDHGVSLSLYGRSERGTWRKGYFTGDSNCRGRLWKWSNSLFIQAM